MTRQSWEVRLDRIKDVKIFESDESVILILFWIHFEAISAVRDDSIP